MALLQSMDVTIEHQSSSSSGGGGGGGGGPPTAVVPAEPTMPASAWDEQTQQQDQPRDHSVIQRVDTPCPAALRRRQHHQQAESSSSSVGGSFVLLPDRTEPGTSRRFIPLEAGQTTVVGRCKSSGIRDHHVSRRHVQITVPEELEEGSAEGFCLIKYIGRNCRVVLVGGLLLKAEQEVPACPGTRIVLNYNNKGLPRYSYTLIPANSLPTMVTSVATVADGRRSSVAGAAAAAAAGRGMSPGVRRLRTGAVPSSPGAGGGNQQQPSHGDPHPHAYNYLHRHPRHPALAGRQKQQQQQQQRQQRSAGGRFRKEAQDKLQKERDDIFSRFADLKFV
ncbi:unnamed protein product [Scytosiphon promiscuus]